jgi:hypothetical protein
MSIRPGFCQFSRRCDRQVFAINASIQTAPRTATPEYHEGDYVARILRTVEHTVTAFVELLAAVSAPEPPIVPSP